MNKYADLPIQDQSQVGEARRIATAHADFAGLNETELGRVAIIVTELANNVIRHAGRGRIVLQQVDRGAAATGIRLLALDQGPGIRSTGEALRDGFSTAGTAGEGLGAIRRLSSVFDIYSVLDQGTVVLSEVWKGPQGSDGFEVGSVLLPFPGEEECGDSLEFLSQQKGCQVIIADGLGHGPLAADASREAVRVFRESRGADPESPLRQIQLIHAALHKTRGAAAAAAFISKEEGTLRFCGLGNIAAAIVSPEDHRIAVSHSGIVGHQAHKFQEFSYPWSAESVLIMASDGISTQWRLERYPGLLRRHAALIAGLLVRDFSRGRDDVSVLVVRDRPDEARWEEKEG